MSSFQKCFFLVSIGSWVAACGDTPNTDNDNNGSTPCLEVTCGAHSQCVPATGECTCDSDFTGDPDAGCTPVTPCTATTCAHQGVCSDASGTATCACQEPYAGETCNNCITDYDLVENVCLNSRTVPCADSAPSNAHSIFTDVETTYTTADGWTAAEDCVWECDDGFDLVGGSCVNRQMVPCTDEAPIHAHSIIADVEITYDANSGWTSPAACVWECDTAYDLVDESCIDQRLVPCAPNAPANATNTIADVEITYDASTGWSTPADCEWVCDTDYYELDGSCLYSCPLVGDTNGNGLCDDEDPPLYVVPVGDSVYGGMCGFPGGPIANTPCAATEVQIGITDTFDSVCDQPTVQCDGFACTVETTSSYQPAGLGVVCPSGTAVVGVTGSANGPPEFTGLEVICAHISVNHDNGSFVVTDATTTTVTTGSAGSIDAGAAECPAEMFGVGTTGNHTLISLFCKAAAPAWE